MKTNKIKNNGHFTPLEEKRAPRQKNSPLGTIRDNCLAHPGSSSKKPLTERSFKVQQHSSNVNTALSRLPGKSNEQARHIDEAYRKTLSKEFDIEQIGNQGNDGIRAVIHTLQPHLDATSQEIAAYILRGDLIAHIRNNPELYFNKLKAEHLEDKKMVKQTVQSYCEEISRSGQAIGEIELCALSEVLGTPIYLHSFRQEAATVFGTQHRCSPIHLYHNPDTGDYHIMKPR